MALSKRASIGLSAVLGFFLTGLVVRDIYVDWAIEGKALSSTVLENTVPLVLGAGFFLATYYLYRRTDATYLSTVTKWQYAGAVGIVALSGWVIGFQVIQGELKPYLIVVQTAVGGALAGTVVGYANASVERTRDDARRQRDRFEALFENAPAEAVDTTLEGDRVTVVSANTSFEGVFGTRDNDTAGRALFDIVDHDEETRDLIRSAIRSEETLETETRVAGGETPLYFQVRVVPHTGQRAYVLYTDVTDIREAQEELERTVDRLERSNERLQQFAYVASHDLQEPLRMVSSYVDLLEAEYGGELGDEADEYIEYAVDGAERMQDMIDALLQYSRVRSKGEEFAEVDADAVLEDALQNLELRIAESGAEVTHGDLPTVEADRNQLGQVFQNLVGNAIDHADRAPSIHVDADRRNGDVVFSVADDGPGIPEDQQDKIFEIFEQRDRDSGGTGMGLAICERIVDRHGGEMWVESEECEGATFYFSIPS